MAERDVFLLTFPSEKLSMQMSDHEDAADGKKVRVSCATPTRRACALCQPDAKLEWLKRPSCVTIEFK